MMKLLVLPDYRMIFWVALLGLAALFFYFYNTVWLKSKRIREKLRIQGIKGPPPASFFSGNMSEMQKISQATKAPNHAEIVSHDYTSTLFPYFEQWRKEYGILLSSFFFLLHLHLHLHVFCLLSV